MGTSRLTVASAALLAAACAAPSGAVRPGGTPLAVTAADGTTVPLEELRAGREATVVVFWSASCPCVRRYQQRVDDLLDRYPAARLRVVGVSSNVGEAFADTLRVARERGVRIPIYRDDGARVAEALGARSTPTVVVLDARGEIRFRGWIDDERLPGDPGREPWLDRALEGILAGRAGFSARTPVYGCPITRSLFGPAPGPCCTATP
jgi:peroxiredoxin